MKKIIITAALLILLSPALSLADVDVVGGVQLGGVAVCYDSRTGEVVVGINSRTDCVGRGGSWGGPLPQYVGPGRSNAPVQDVNDALGVLVGIIRLAQIVFWVLTVGFGLYAAYLYLFSQGNKESAVQARRVFIYTIIAAILAVLAYAVPGVIDTWLTGN